MRGLGKQRNRPNRTTSARTSNERVKSLVHEGAYTKAIKAIDSVGTHEPTERIQNELLSKHPQTRPETDALLPTPIPTYAPLVPSFSYSRGMKSFATHESFQEVHQVADPDSPLPTSVS